MCAWYSYRKILTARHLINDGYIFVYTYLRVTTKCVVTQQCV